MSLSTADHLDAMINDIARNHSYLSPDKAAAQIASHISRFWAPSMIAMFLERHSDGTDGLEPGAAEAVAILRQQAA